MKKIAPFLVFLTFIVNISCSTSGVYYTAKFFKDSNRDDSFPVFANCESTGPIIANIMIKPLITDLSRFFHKKEPTHIPLCNELNIQGELIKHGWVNTNEFALFFLLGLETDYYTYKGTITVNEISHETSMDIYFHHDKQGGNRQFDVMDICCDKWILQSTSPYGNPEVLTPYKMFVCSDKESDYNIFITQTLNWNVSGDRADDIAYVEEHWPKIGAWSLLTSRGQVVQICDDHYTVLAEIKNVEGVRTYFVYVPEYDERYEGLMVTIGLLDSYYYSITKLKNMSM